MKESGCPDCKLTFPEHTAGAQPDGLSDTGAALRKDTLCAHLATRVRCLIFFLPFAPSRAQWFDHPKVTEWDPTRSHFPAL